MPGALVAHYGWRSPLPGRSSYVRVPVRPEGRARFAGRGGRRRPAPLITAALPRGFTAWMPRSWCQGARPPWPMEDGRPRLLIRMRSWQARVTGDTRPSHCAAPFIRRGCRVHAVQTTWLWHPCRMVWYVRCQSGPELPSCPRAVPTLISGSGPIVIQGEREHRVSRSAGGARQGSTLAGADAGPRGADAGRRVSAGADAGQRVSADGGRVQRARPARVGGRVSAGDARSSGPPWPSRSASAR